MSQEEKVGLSILYVARSISKGSEGYGAMASEV